MFRGQRYFQCDPNCGLFVALEKLRPYEGRNDGAEKNDVEKEPGDESILTKVKNRLAEGFSNFSNLVSTSGQPNEEHCSKLEDETTGHKLNDKVWVFINDELCGGVLKYIGRVPGGGGEIHAGIYLVCDSIFGSPHYCRKPILLFLCQALYLLDCSLLGLMCNSPSNMSIT